MDEEEEWDDGWIQEDILPEPEEDAVAGEYSPGLWASWEEHFYPKGDVEDDDPAGSN